MKIIINHHAYFIVILTTVLIASYPSSVAMPNGKVEEKYQQEGARINLRSMMGRITIFSSNLAWRQRNLVSGIFLLLAILTGPWFVEAFCPHTFVAVGHYVPLLLEAKNTQKRKKRVSAPRGGGRRGKAKRNGLVEEDNDETDTNEVRDPRSLRKRLIELPREEQILPLRVSLIEVDDREWWEEDSNPTGARLWPSSLAIAEFLASINLKNYELLELGCGAGLASIVAAECGACVMATDISPLAIKLCRMGWKETQKAKTMEELAKKKKREQKEKLRQQFQRWRQSTSDGAVPTTGAVSPTPSIPPAADKPETPKKTKSGTLQTSIFDLCSDIPLPLSAANQDDSLEDPPKKKMVIATTLLYEAGLATRLAQRALEACKAGAWVMIGDDDSGQREGGRSLFVAELDRLQQEFEKQQEQEEHDIAISSFSRIWTTTKVRSKALQWNEKQVQILHLNAPKEFHEQLKQEGAF